MKEMITTLRNDWTSQETEELSFFFFFLREKTWGSVWVFKFCNCHLCLLQPTTAAKKDVSHHQIILLVIIIFIILIFLLVVFIPVLFIIQIISQCSPSLSTTSTLSLLKTKVCKRLYFKMFTHFYRCIRNNFFILVHKGPRPTGNISRYSLPLGTPYIYLKFFSNKSYKT